MHFIPRIFHRICIFLNYSCFAKKTYQMSLFANSYDMRNKRPSLIRRICMPSFPLSCKEQRCGMQHFSLLPSLQPACSSQKVTKERLSDFLCNLPMMRPKKNQNKTTPQCSQSLLEAEFAFLPSFSFTRDLLSFLGIELEKNS